MILYLFREGVLATPSVPKYKNVFNIILVSKTFLYYETEGVAFTHNSRDNSARKKNHTVLEQRRSASSVQK